MIRSRLSLRPGRRALATSIAAAAATLAITLAPIPANALTTPGLIVHTATAAVSCLSYQVEGVCFFLRCKIAVCWIETSMKISHYVPDVVISTYNEPLRHPWTDLGTVVATAVTGAGSTILGRALDSSAGGLDTPSAMTNYKSADAIGNPAAQLAAMVAGGGVTLPKSMPVPGVGELARFISHELPNIGRAWTQVPNEIKNTVAADAKKMLDAPAELLAGLRTMMKAVEGVRQVIELAETAQQITETVSTFQELGRMVSGITGGSMLFCPGGSSPFNLHMQTELDAPFWRGVLPVEMLYPQSWVPGMGELGSGLTSTWGPVYPRTGEVIQSHPVKASAVLASRVASIIYSKAQPHIYAPVVGESSSHRYFGSSRPLQWQMLHPNPAGHCVTFGGNDSLSLTTFGDFQTDPADGYSWNLWKHYVCCQSRGRYLFSVP